MKSQVTKEKHPMHGNSSRSSRARHSKARKLRADYQPLEPRQLLASVSPETGIRTFLSDVPDRSQPHEIVVNYQDDFANENSGFGFHWNAPLNWQANGSKGDTTQGSLQQMELHRDLVFDGTAFRAGDVPVNNFPANRLFLDSEGGHVGTHSFHGNNHDRFAIVSYEVKDSGFYSIVDSVFSKIRSFGDGIEVKIWVGNDEVKTESTESGGQFSVDFDSNLGFIRAGEKIFVAVGPGETHIGDRFNWDFSIAKFEGTQVGNYRDNFADSNWSYYWNAPANWNPNQAEQSANAFAPHDVGDVANYRELVPGNVMTPDGNRDGTDNFPAGHLRLHRGGGMVGMHTNSNNVTDRFAISAFEVSDSGYYAITDSWLEKLSDKGNGIELIVHDSEGKTLINRIVQPLEGTSFDMHLGYLAKGEKFYVAVGADGNHVLDRFHLNFSVVSEPLLRSEPVRNFATEHTIHVKDFGATPNDGLDDRPQVQRAINAAINHQRITGQAVTVQLDSGTYRFGVANNENLRVQNASNIIFQGAGQNDTELLFTRPNSGGFRISDSENLIFRDFNIDYEILPFTQGEILSVVDTDTVIVKVDDGYRAPNDHQLFNRNLTTHRTQFLAGDRSGRLLNNESYVLANLNSVAEISPGVFEISYRRELPKGLKSGDAWYQVARINNRSNFGVYRNDGFITLSRITAYAGPPGLIQGQGNGAINVLDVRVDLKDDRLVSILGAAVHASRNKVGVWVEGSTFVGLSDDIMNIYRQERDYIQQQLAPNRFSLNTDVDLHAGERVVFYRADGYRQEAKIASVSKGLLVTDRAILGFDNATKLAPLDHASVGSVIRDNVIERHRAGLGSLIVWSPNTMIIGNQFRGINTHAIATNAYEDSTLSDGLVVQGNRFQDIGFSAFAGVTEWAAIEVGENTQDNYVLDNVFDELFGDPIEDTSKGTHFDGNQFANGDQVVVKKRVLA